MRAVAMSWLRYKKPDDMNEARQINESFEVNQPETATTSILIADYHADLIEEENRIIINDEMTQPTMNFQK